MNIKKIGANLESGDKPNYMIGKFSIVKYNKSPIRFQKTYYPEFNYGISLEAPSNFRGEYTVLNKKTYDNKYLECNKKQVKITSPCLKNVDEDEIKRRDLTFNQLYKNLKNEPKSFGKTKGLFVDFIQRNSIMNIFGSLMSRDRSYDPEKYKKKKKSNSFGNIQEISKIETSSLVKDQTEISISKNIDLKPTENKHFPNPINLSAKSLRKKLSPINIDSYLRRDQKTLNVLQKQVNRENLLFTLKTKEKNQPFAYVNQRKKWTEKSETEANQEEIKTFERYLSFFKESKIK